MSNDDERLPSFYKAWKDFTKENDLKANHLWNTDETGEDRLQMYLVLPSSRSTQLD